MRRLDQRVRDLLFELAQRSLLGFCAVVCGAGLLAGVLLGPVAEAGVLGMVMAWLAWEARPKVYLALGLHERAAGAARRLAAASPGRTSGDLHRLTEAVALLSLGRMDEAKASLAQVDPVRLPERGRYAYFLDLSVLFLQLGDGETALAMVDASEAAVETLGLRWPGLTAINRSAALCELGRFDEAAACLDRVELASVPPSVRAYLHNNLAWALGFGSGDKRLALEHAERAAGLRGADPACQGTLGMCLLLAGQAPEAAVPFLEGALEHADRRSPLGKAMLYLLAAHAFRAVGEETRARELEGALPALPRIELGRAILAGSLPDRDAVPRLE